MGAHSRLYPYPVLENGTDSFTDSSLHFSADTSISINNVLFSFNFNLHNDDMLKLIDKGDAVYLVHIECGPTCLRKAIASKEANFSTLIRKDQMSGQVSISPFIVAARDISDYCNSQFNPVFNGTVFSLEKGSILAIGDQAVFNADRHTETLGRKPSIFTLALLPPSGKIAVTTTGEMTVNYSEDKIVIQLQEETYHLCTKLNSSPLLAPVIHAAVLVPALVHVLDALKNDSSAPDIYREKRWYRAIDKKLEESGITLDSLADADTLSLALKLLDQPVSRACKAILGFVSREEEMEED